MMINSLTATPSDTLICSRHSGYLFNKLGISHSLATHWTLSALHPPPHLLPILQDDDISKSKVRYYSNSLQHRVKNRVWQTLLLLLPKLREVRPGPTKGLSQSTCACVVIIALWRLDYIVCMCVCVLVGVCCHFAGPCVWSWILQ